MSVAPALGRPQRSVLDGRYVRLEPLGPEHAADLWAASSDAGFVNVLSGFSDIEDFTARPGVRGEEAYYWGEIDPPPSGGFPLVP